MERSDGSDRMAIFREVCCSLLMLLLGLLFCLPIATLAYFCFQSTAECVTFCSLWVDIPGRLVIFMTCCYIASICGFFPLPRRYHLSTFLMPFNVWRLKSWRRLFRNMCFPTRRLINCSQRNVSPIRNSLETPPPQENNEERFRDNFQRGRQSEPIDIRYPKSYIVPVFVSDPEITPRNESPEVNKDSDGSITSIGSSLCVFANQMTKGKSSSRYCTSAASVEVSPDDRARVTSKYRKRYTEINLMEEAAANAPLPVAYDNSILNQRPAKTLNQRKEAVNKKPAALTDDERLKISKKERRRLARERPQVHTNEPVLVPRLSSRDDTLPRDESKRLLEQKSVPLNEGGMFVAERDHEIRLKHEMLKTHAADERIRPPTSSAVRLPNQPRMHGRVKHPQGITVNYKVKSPPKYLEIYAETKDANALTSVDHDHAPVTSEQPLADKYFAPVDVERHATSRQQEPTRSAFERLNLHAVDGQIKVPTEKKLCAETKIQSTTHRRNRQPGGATAINEQGPQPKLCNTETQVNFPGIRDRKQQPGGAIAINEQGPQPKLCNTETQVNFPGIRDRKQQPGGATAINEQGPQPKLCNSETQVNFPGIRDRKQQPGGAIANPGNVRNNVAPRTFPRIPWIKLRNPRGLSAYANKLHIKNLEREKRETERYYEEERQRSQTDFNKLVKDITEDCSERITQMQLPIRSENIRLTPRRSFQMRDFSTKCSDGQSVRHKTGLGIVKDNIDLAKNRHKVTEKQEVENMDKSHTTNQGPPFFVPRSGLIQRQYVERSNAAEATTSHRLLPAQNFQVKTRSCSHTQDKAGDKTDFKLEMHRRDDQNDSGQKALAEAGPSNLSKLEQDAERTGTLRPVTVENLNESFNRLQLEGLRRRRLPSEQGIQIKTEASVAVESKTNFDTKREVRTTDVNHKESNISTKPSEVKKPDVKISIDSSSSSGKSDSESGSEQSKR